MGKRRGKNAENQDTPRKSEGRDKPKKRKKRRVRKLLFLLVVGGAGALALSEDARNKALDALFGSEEEFQYSPPSSPSGDDGGGAPESV
jgi:hypothetical protein